MRYGDAIADSGWELSLPLQHGLKHILYARAPHSLSGPGLGAISIDQKLDQLTQHALLTLGPQWYPDAVGREQFSQSQWGSSKCRNRLKIVDLS